MESEGPLEEDSLLHTFGDHRHEEEVQASAPESFLDSNGTGSSAPDVVENLAPPAPPSELLLYPDHDIEEVASEGLDLPLPLSRLHELEDTLLDDLARIEPFFEDSAGDFGPIHGLDLGCARVHHIQDALLNQLLGWALHEDLGDAESPLLGGGMARTVHVAFADNHEDASHVVLERPRHVLLVIGAGVVESHVHLLEGQVQIRFLLLESDGPKLVDELVDAFTELVARILDFD